MESLGRDPSSVVQAFQSAEDVAREQPSPSRRCFVYLSLLFVCATRVQVITHKLLPQNSRSATRCQAFAATRYQVDIVFRYQTSGDNLVFCGKQGRIAPATRVQEGPEGGPSRITALEASAGVWRGFTGAPATRYQVIGTVLIATRVQAVGERHPVTGGTRSPAPLANPLRRFAFTQGRLPDISAGPAGGRRCYQISS